MWIVLHHKGKVIVFPLTFQSSFSLGVPFLIDFVIQMKTVVQHFTASTAFPARVWHHPPIDATAFLYFILLLQGKQFECKRCSFLAHACMPRYESSYTSLPLCCDMKHQTFWLSLLQEKLIFFSVFYKQCLEIPPFPLRLSMLLLDLFIIEFKVLFLDPFFSLSGNWLIGQILQKFQLLISWLPVPCSS